MFRTWLFYMRFTIRELMKSPALFLILIGLPIILSLLLGKIQSQDFSLKDPIPLSIEINGGKTDAKTEAFLSFFETDEAKQYFRLTEDAPNQVVLYHPLNRIGNKAFPVFYAEDPELSSSEKYIMSEIFRSLVDQIVLQDEMQKIGKENLIPLIMATAQQNPYKYEVLTDKPGGMDMESTLPRFFILGYVMLCMAFYQGMQKLKEEGVVGREMSSPITKKQYMFLLQSGCFVQMVIAMIGFYLFYKLTGSGFRQVSLFEILPLIAVASVFASSLALLLIVFVKKQVGIVVTLVLMYFQMFVAGMFYNFTDSSLIGKIMMYLPTRQNTISVQGLLNGLGLTSICKELLIVLSVGLVLSFIAYLNSRKLEA